MNRYLPLLLVLIATALTTSPAVAREARWVGETLEGRPCSDLLGALPRSNVFDYTDPSDRANHLPIVEAAHFTDQVRQLRAGRHGGHPLNDLEYTVGRFPNHHAALYAMIRYATEARFREESARAWASATRDERERPPPECYLQRAQDFARHDAQVRALTGLYYHRVGRHDPARTAYEEALTRTNALAEIHYNYGLLLVDMGRYAEAREQAELAYGLGYPLPGLRRQLAAAGHAIDD